MILSGLSAPPSGASARVATANAAAQREFVQAIRRPRAAGDDLGDEERVRLRELQARDRQVRQHEQAHLAAAGTLAVSGANFSYETGPDGRRYAVGGDVRIDTSEGRTAQQTLDRAEIILRAALAPRDPSTTDRQVAGAARQMAFEARLELARERALEQDTAPSRVAGAYDAVARNAHSAAATLSAFA